MGISIDIERSVSLEPLKPKFATTVKQSVKMCAVDLLRVSQERAPYDTGTLEKSGHLTISSSNYLVRGLVGFSAVNRGFNYALWTDKKQYTPSSKSLAKGGGRSTMYAGTLPVGTGYLSDTAKKCKLGYELYIAKKIGSSIASSGFHS